MLRLGLMQARANWTGPVWNLDRHGPAGQQEGRGGERVRDAVGIERVARSAHLTGCFIKQIKHGQALLLRIIPDLHSGGMESRIKRKKDRGVRGGREKNVATRTSDG